MPEPVTAWVGLGANIGDVTATLSSAEAALGHLPGTKVVRSSRRYRSAAWGPVAQPDFVNAVCAIRTGLEPLPLMVALLDIERHHGRDRRESGLRWGPRTIDLDLLLYGELELDRDGLALPHPRMHERAFVLVPLAEVSSGLRVPGRGTVEDLLAGLDAAGVEAIP